MQTNNVKNRIVFEEDVCPICGSTDIEFDGFDLTDNATVKNECKCNQCKAEFTQWYQIKYKTTSIHHKEPYEDF